MLTLLVSHARFVEEKLKLSMCNINLLARMKLTIQSFWRGKWSQLRLVSLSVLMGLVACSAHQVAIQADDESSCD